MALFNDARRKLVGLIAGFTTAVGAGAKISTLSETQGDDGPASEQSGHQQASSAAALAVYPKTTGEVAAAIAVVNQEYPAGNILRYGADAACGDDSTLALRAAIKVASQDFGPTVYIPPGRYKITAVLKIPAGKQVNIQGAGKFLSILYAENLEPDSPVLHFAGTEKQRIDAISIGNFAIWSNNKLARGITAAWVINSIFHEIYFYDLHNGYVASCCFGIAFRNNNSYNIRNSVYTLSTACSNNVFDVTRAASCKYGIVVNGEIDTLKISGCDFEGVAQDGAAILLSPSHETIISNIEVTSSHFENINGVAIQCTGIEPGGVRGLVIRGNTITGGFAAMRNVKAVDAVWLPYVSGFEVSYNNFSDWGTADERGGGTPGHALAMISSARNGEFVNNCSLLSPSTQLTVQNISDCIPDHTIRIANNWIPKNGNEFRGFKVPSFNPNMQTIAFSSKPIFDFAMGAFIVFTADGDFLFPDPINTVQGVSVRVLLRNAAKTSLHVTWGKLIKQNFSIPSPGNSGVIELTAIGSYFVQTNGTDVPA